MKRTNYLFPSIFPLLLLIVLIVACTPTSDDGLSEDERVETRAAEIIKATTDFELAVENGVAERATEDAKNNPPTEPPPTSTAAAPPTPTATSALTATSETGSETSGETDSGNAEGDAPTPTLFPLVKQGAPGNRQGLEGNIFAPEGLQISSDPAIYGTKISFMALGLFDTDIGNNEGDGVKRVTFTITDANGKVVHRSVDETPFYCAFGGSSPCTEWDFSANGNKWPNGEAAESGQFNTQIEASGANSSRFSIWTYDFSIDLGGENANQPKPTPTLFPLVKQGAPGDRQGIEGSVFAPAGLQLSADPAVYGQRISFLLVGALDPNTGSYEGDGVDTVTFTIFDSNGNEVFKSVDADPFYCAFGGNNPCTIWDFSKNNGQWPNGTPVQSGNYNTKIEAKGKDASRFSIWAYDFAIDLNETQPTAAPTWTAEAEQTPQVNITGIALNGDRYSVDFSVSGYQPTLPGMHMHFFFDNVPADQAGAPGGGPWQIYPNVNGAAASSPFTLFGINDRPAGSNQLCVLVANSNHSVNQGSGNCFPLP